MSFFRVKKEKPKTCFQPVLVHQHKLAPLTEANIMNKHGPDGHKKMQDFDQRVVMLRAAGCEALDRLSEADVE